MYVSFEINLSISLKMLCTIYNKYVELSIKSTLYRTIKLYIYIFNNVHMFFFLILFFYLILFIMAILSSGHFYTWTFLYRQGHF